MEAPAWCSVTGWHRHRHHAGPSPSATTRREGWGLLPGHQWGPRLGHQWGLSHGHGHEAGLWLGPHDGRDVHRVVALGVGRDAAGPGGPRLTEGGPPAARALALSVRAFGSAPSTTWPLQSAVLVTGDSGCGSPTSIRQPGRGPGVGSLCLLGDAPRRRAGVGHDLLGRFGEVAGA